MNALDEDIGSSNRRRRRPRLNRNPPYQQGQGMVPLEMDEFGLYDDAAPPRPPPVPVIIESWDGTSYDSYNGSARITVPDLLVTVLIGIQGTTIQRIQQRSRCIRIHIHPREQDLDEWDIHLPRVCEMWGTREATHSAHHMIQNILDSCKQWSMIKLSCDDAHIVTGPHKRELKRLEEQSECYIVIRPRRHKSDQDRNIYLIGSPAAQSRAKVLIGKTVSERDLIACGEKKILTVPTSMMRRIIGKNGDKIRAIKEDTGCRIWYDRRIAVGPNNQPVPQKITLNGTDLAVGAAALRIEMIMREVEDERRQAFGFSSQLYPEPPFPSSSSPPGNFAGMSPALDGFCSQFYQAPILPSPNTPPDDFAATKPVFEGYLSDPSAAPSDSLTTNPEILYEQEAQWQFEPDVPKSAENQSDSTAVPSDSSTPIPQSPPQKSLPVQSEANVPNTSENQSDPTSGPAHSSAAPPRLCYKQSAPHRSQPDVPSVPGGLWDSIWAPSISLTTQLQNPPEEPDLPQPQTEVTKALECLSASIWASSHSSTTPPQRFAEQPAPRQSHGDATKASEGPLHPTPAPPLISIPPPNPQLKQSGPPLTQSDVLKLPQQAPSNPGGEPGPSNSSFTAPRLTQRPPQFFWQIPEFENRLTLESNDDEEPNVTIETLSPYHLRMMRHPTREDDSGSASPPGSGHDTSYPTDGIGPTEGQGEEQENDQHAPAPPLNTTDDQQEESGSAASPRPRCKSNGEDEQDPGGSTAPRINTHEEQERDPGGSPPLWRLANERHTKSDPGLSPPAHYKSPSRRKSADIERGSSDPVQEPESEH